MRWLNGNRKRSVLVVFVAAIVLGGGSVKADFTFGEPTNLGPTVNSSAGDAINCISSDGLEMYLDSNRSGGYGGWDIWVAKRETIEDDWGAPTNLGSTLNSPQIDSQESISFDGLELYFGSSRPSAQGGFGIWVSRRDTKKAEWGAPVELGPFFFQSNTYSGAAAPSISTDGIELYFSSDRTGGYGNDDIWASRRATVNDLWEEPVNLGSVVNTQASEHYPFLSADGLVLFFSEERGRTIRLGGYGNVDMWVTRRASLSEPWGTPVNLGPIVNSPSLDCGPRVSHDGSMLYFSSERSGGLGGPYGDIYQAPIVPIVDFNGDGIVDSADMCIMVDHWGENYSLCDIGPMPWGDGVVDVQDLIVLAEHLFEEVSDPTLIAHWPLDEAQGLVAYNIASDCDGTLIGDPVWQPDDGMVAGSLQFDGIDDYVETGFVLNPAYGKFSAVAWIKGGIPGQVIVSQAGGADWLCADPSEGRLMTSLGPPPGRFIPPPLVSELVITNGDWHRIGFMWDGSHRRLCVDGVVAAEDTQAVLADSANGLYLGCGKAMGAGTFWSGLVDDIRIYSRVVSP